MMYEAEPTEKLLRDTLDSRKKKLGPKHLDTLETMSDLNAWQYSQGQYDEPELEARFRDVLDGLRETLGEKHLHDERYWKTMSDYGSLLKRARHSVGNMRKAEEMYRAALAGQRETLGENHAETLSSQNRLAVLLSSVPFRRFKRSSDESDEAETLFRATLDARRKTLGNKHLDTLLSMQNLGEFYRGKKKLDEAETLLREGYTGIVQVFGKKDENVLAMEKALCRCYEMQGERGKSAALQEPRFKDELMRLKDKLGPHHKKTLDAMHSLGQNLEAQGKHEEAEVYFRAALEGSRQSLVGGDQNGDTLASMSVLAQNLESQGKLADAEQMYRQCYNGRREKFGAHSDQASRSKKRLIDCLRAQNKEAEANALEEVVVKIPARGKLPSSPSSSSSSSSLSSAAAAEAGRGSLRPRRRRQLRVPPKTAAAAAATGEEQQEQDRGGRGGRVEKEEENEENEEE